jgi:flagellum-specific ATP synthase
MSSSGLELTLQKYYGVMDVARLSEDRGKITQVVGQMMLGYLPGATVGSICDVYPTSTSKSFQAEVVGFRDRNVLLMPLGEMRGVGLGSRIILRKSLATVKVGPGLLGRIVNAFGEPMDGKGPIDTVEESAIYTPVSNPLDREPVREPMDLGVRALNSMITVGRGQRVGIMAGSGVGKSVLLGMMAKGSNSDINVIALIGERGREVKEFIEEIMGEEGMKRTVVVVATSDQSPLARMRGAFVATTISEYFCNEGANVLLMMDSVTRFAMAQREIGLSTGEPPASKGYTPSVFALLPKMLERVGNFENKGSITGLYTVLVEGDDMDDPIGDAVRSIVDGHIVLTRSLAQKGHFPAIDVLQSTSRVMRSVTTREHLSLAKLMRENMAIYSEAEDLINIGAYKAGANRDIDTAIQLHPHITQFLRQDVDDHTNMQDTLQQMQNILSRA